MERKSIALLVAVTVTAAAAATAAAFWIRRKKTPPDLGLVTAPALKPLAAAKGAAGGTEDKVFTGHLGEVKDEAVSETSIPGDYKAALSAAPLTRLGEKDAKIAELDASSTGESARLGASLEEVRAELIHLEDNHNCMNINKQEDVASASASGIVSDQFASTPELDSLTAELKPEPHEPHLQSIEKLVPMVEDNRDAPHPPYQMTKSSSLQICDNKPNVTRQKPFQLLTEKRGWLKEENFQKKVNNALVEEEKKRRFKARPVPSFDHYFTPKKSTRPPTVPKDPNFCLKRTKENMATEALIKVEPSLLSSAKKASSSIILYRRRKSFGSLRIHNDNDGSHLQESNHSERLCRVLFDSVKESKEDTYTLMPIPQIFVRNEAEEASSYQNKENLTPNYSLGWKPKNSILRLQRSPSNELALLDGGDVSVNPVKDENEDPLAHSYKIDLTPCTSFGRKRNKNFLMSQRSASNDLSALNEKEQMFSPDIFIPNKENLTPKVCGATRQKPFELMTEKRGRLKEESFRKKVNNALVEEEKKRRFKAQAMPSFDHYFTPKKSIETPNLTRQKPFQLLTEKRGRIKEESFRKKVNSALVEEEKKRRFKARSVPSFDHYFTPKKLTMPPTVPKDPNFCL